MGKGDDDDDIDIIVYESLFSYSRGNRYSFVNFWSCQVDLNEAKLHIIVHNVIPISKILRVDNIFACIRYTSLNHVDELQLGSDGDFLVAP
jgi:hypothetical protein